jgi:hypothetical protein
MRSERRKKGKKREKGDLEIGAMLPVASWNKELPPL